jgi:hypothetical protein
VAERWQLGLDATNANQFRIANGTDLASARVMIDADGTVNFLGKTGDLATGESIRFGNDPDSVGIELRNSPDPFIMFSNDNLAPFDVILQLQSDNQFRFSSVETTGQEYLFNSAGETKLTVNAEAVGGDQDAVISLDTVDTIFTVGVDDDSNLFKISPSGVLEDSKIHMTTGGALNILGASSGTGDSQVAKVQIGSDGSDPNIEIRGGAADTPYIDFATNATDDNTPDYDARIQLAAAKRLLFEAGGTGLFEFDFLGTGPTRLNIEASAAGGDQDAELRFDTVDTIFSVGLDDDSNLLKIAPSGTLENSKINIATTGATSFLGTSGGTGDAGFEKVLIGSDFDAPNIELRGVSTDRPHIDFVRNATSDSAPDFDARLVLTGVDSLDMEGVAFFNLIGNDSGGFIQGIRTFSSNPSTTGNFDLIRSRGTKASPLVALEDDILGNITGWGMSTTGGLINRSAGITFAAEGDFTVSSSPGRMEFKTTLNGTTALATKMTLTNNGSLILDTGSSVPGLNFDNSASSAILFTETADHPGGAPAGARGTVWLKNTSPNALVFTDDEGTDFTLNHPTVTLDTAYDAGGAGLGRTIVADSGNVDINSTGVSVGLSMSNDTGGTSEKFNFVVGCGGTTDEFCIEVANTSATGDAAPFRVREPLTGAQVEIRSGATLNPGLLAIGGGSLGAGGGIVLGDSGNKLVPDIENETWTIQNSDAGSLTQLTFRARDDVGTATIPLTLLSSGRIIVETTLWPTTGGDDVQVTAGAGVGKLLHRVVSSRRYKTKIQDTVVDSEGIYKLIPRDYYLKSEPHNSREFGLIAEEVQEVFPMIVSYEPETGLASSVRYEKLGILAVMELKKLRKRIEDLEKKVLDLSYLEDRVSDIEKKLEALSK